VRLVAPLVAALAVLMAVVSPVPALAAAPPVVPVSLSITAPQAATIGTEVIVPATIRRRDNVAPTGLRVALYIGGHYIQSEHADTLGHVAFRVRGVNTQVAGKYAIEARFDGARGLAPARVATTMVLRPAHIKIATVPAVVGLPVMLGTQSVSTGTDGIAEFDVSRVGNLSLDPLVNQTTDPSTRVSFGRWSDSVYVPTRTISIQGDATYTLGLRTAYKTSVHFVDLAGAAVDPALIGRVRFTSSTGGEVVLTSFGDSWWEAGTAVARTGGLQPSPTLWRLAEVDMAGTNVVNQGQQAFNPTINGDWTISLLLYDLDIRAEDALTGGTLGGSVDLVYPDASIRRQPVGLDGSAHFTALPRGSYSVKVNASGMTPPTPVALSRSQSASIRVISYLDIGLAIGVGLLIVFGLLMLRYRRLGVLLRVAHGPAVVARRLGLGRVPDAVRRGLPPAAAAMGRLPSDMAAIEGGRTAAAFALVTSAARRVWQEVRRLSGAAAGAVLATRSGVSAALPARRSNEPEGPQAMTAVLSARRSRVQESPTAVAAALPARRSRPAQAAPAAVPAWPTTQRDTQERSLLRPAKPIDLGMRPVVVSPTSDSETPEPTHECAECHAQVPDSARFCRMCGHVQR
jgi:hypothetical protein